MIKFEQNIEKKSRYLIIDFRFMMNKYHSFLTNFQPVLSSIFIFYVFLSLIQYLRQYSDDLSYNYKNIILQKHPFLMEDQPPKKLRILAISDTHYNHHLIDTTSWPQADVFIHAGDFTITSTSQEFNGFRNFLKRLPYKHKLVVAGNHDFGLESSQELYKKIAGWWQVPQIQMVDTEEQMKKLRQVCTLLQHECVEIEGVTFFGTPHVWLNRDMAFTLPQITKDQIWKKKPEKLDVLITHMPPYGVGDLTYQKAHVGCRRLMNAVREIGPKVHIFGHIHESYGEYVVNQTRFYNVCYMDQHYSPKNGPKLIEIEIPSVQKQSKAL